MAVKEVLKVEKRSGSSPRPSAGDPVTTMETITPAKALKWLEANTNRPISNSFVESYARDMASGKWSFSNDAICFDVDSNIINGQHRLSACALAGVPFRAIIIRNLPKEAQESMDQGKPRRLPDILALRGHTRNARLSGALRALINIKNWEGYRKNRPSNAELLDTLQAHPRLVDSVVATDGVCAGMSTSMLSALHYVAKYMLKEPDKADAFARVFTTGIPAYSQDPAHALREFALKHRARKSRQFPHVQFYSAIAAWNAFRKGETRDRWVSPREAKGVDGLNVDKI